MKYLTAGAWIFTILGIAAIAAHWPQIKWYLANKTTVDQAIETADSLQKAGLLK